MRLLFLLLALFVPLVLAPAQGTPPSVIPQIAVHIKFVEAVVGLSFNATTHAQEAVFAVSVDGPPTPAGCVRKYAWTSSTLTFDDPTAGSTTARASATGIYYATCAVSDGQPGGKGAITAVDAGSDSGECAAIGGPITTSSAPTSDGRNYHHDGNDPRNSFYLTNYNYSHASAKPYQAEATIDADMTAPAQPQGSDAQGHLVAYTTFTWTLPSKTYSANALGPTTDPSTGKITALPTSVHLSAEGDFEDGVPSISFHFDDGKISGDAVDDSASTQDSYTDSSTHAQSYIPHVYKVSGHVPRKPLVDASDPDATTHHRDKPQGADYWTDEQWYRYILQDTKGAAMPGVWVQERFTDGNPLGLNVNGTGTYWLTLLNSTMDSGKVDPTDGIFGNGNNLGNYDVLYYTWIPPDSADKTTVHVYYAGTRDATYNVTTGVNVGTYQISFVHGQPGSASQSGS